MKKVEAYLRPEKLEDLKEALGEHQINGMTISQVMGCGNQKGWKKFIRGTEVDYNFLQKIKIEFVVSDDQVDRIVDAIIDKSATGEYGDGKIFVYNVDDAIRIRTNERGEEALK